MKIIEPNYWVFKNELPPGLCQAIVDEGLKLELIKARVGQGDEGIISTDQRKSKIGWFPPQGWVAGITQFYMRLANEQAWKFDIQEQESPQFTIYKKGQFYDTHRDDDNFNNVNCPSIRKLSLVATITPSNKYKGGIFKLDGQELPEMKELGTIIVFPSGLEHTAGAVDKGTRYSLVNWFRGPGYR